MSDALTVEAIGWAAITDLGRRATHLGQSVGGALDQLSARLANALVGNTADRPLIELMAQGGRFRVHRDLLLALTGSIVATVDENPIRPYQPLVVRGGQLLAIERIEPGLRGYLAVRGGFAAQSLLGSCAPDAFIGFGALLEAGDVLGSSDDVALGGLLRGQLLTRVGVEDVIAPDPDTIEVTVGPHATQFGDVDRLYAEEYVVSHRSNQVGLRLAGRVPQERAAAEIRSSGVPIGAVEVPGGDELLVLHRSRGVTAGYPVVAVATSFGLDTLAQVRPGQRVRFRLVEVADAVRRARLQRQQIETVARRAAGLFEGLGLPRIGDVR
ncbi:MAG: hypothetical protein QM650_07470 [Microlunatus sp.]